ncbi:hypothetical protein DICPUDRAFT_89145 [Dictyostelium purpureum]|uniref:UBX domain-containing protein n=1 Tax=Dictyostelium purpureum TaxID=5786 RepID=F0ZTZ7_DICPU|nr:uncharacterized protein DICPUDRAFT_89145 [Dictyostelium purpureum]EGC32590.1 hypothetical protein DICPUDRAFT_89145 [Dictyostelium purpureum]|eukprot:XP_003290881.1 hypothetical protein DICPUDRAFT_89145 [Dictyostelium purpureum]
MDPDTVANFLSITGCEDEGLALQILEQNNWNIENSVNFFFSMNDGGASGSSSSTNKSSSESIPSGYQDYMEDDVRAPIPQMMDRLVDHIPQQTRRYQKPGNVFEAFRDFEKERNLNQNKLTDKQKTLAELFKPPLDILSFGTFDEIKKFAEEKELFLLVNIQDVSEFDCQKLNRDTWSNKDLKQLIKDSMIFWQVNKQSGEGIYFTQVYPVTQYPYIAIIDPRTGQKLADIHGFIDAEEMIEYLHQFFVSNSWTGKVEPMVTKSKKKKHNTEEEELEMAIQLSLQHEKPPSPPTPIKRQRERLEKEKQEKLKRDMQNSDNQNDQEDDQEDDQEYDQEEDEDDYFEDDIDNYDDNYYYGGGLAASNNGEKQFKEEIKEKVHQTQEINSKVGTEGDVSIQIRCPGEILKGSFHSTDKIQSVYYFVKVKTGIQDFKLVTSFPRVELSGDLMFKTLKEMDLVPRAVINLQTN